MDDQTPKNRKQRRAGESQNAKEGQTGISDTKFLKLVSKFVDVANRENQKINATDLHMAFLYAAARYNAHVAKNVLDVDEHEPYVERMMASYQEMLRQNLADPDL